MNQDGRDGRANDQIALYILQERLNELKDSHRQKEHRDIELFEQLTSNQRMLSERLLVVETNQEHLSKAILKLAKESSLQTKILTGILLACVSAVVGIIVKAILGA